jgi:hypothetical protein
VKRLITGSKPQETSSTFQNPYFGQTPVVPLSTSCTMKRENLVGRQTTGDALTLHGNNDNDEEFINDTVVQAAAILVERHRGPRTCHRIFCSIAPQSSRTRTSLHATVRCRFCRDVSPQGFLHRGFRQRNLHTRLSAPSTPSGRVECEHCGAR